MNILFIHQDICMYGASRSLLELIEQLSKKGHLCFVLVPTEGELTAEFNARNIPYSTIPWRVWTCNEGTGTSRRLVSGLWSFLRNSVRLNHAAKTVNLFAPDIIHTNSSKTAFGSMLAIRMGKPHTWHFREFLGGEFSAGIVFSLGQRISGKWIGVSSSAVVVISRVLERRFEHIAKKVPIHTVYNSVMSLSEMLKTVQTPFPSTTPLTLSMVGRFDPLKQPLLALEAIKILRDGGKDIKLIMAGWGEPDDVDRVKQYISTNKLSACVELRGFVEDISEVYASSHALLICSIGEAFGRVTAEAMAYGRPVIGANAGATPELINHGVNGLLFNPNNPKDLAEKISRTIVDPDLLQHMSNAAIETAKDRYTREKYGEAMEGIFLRAIKK